MAADILVYRATHVPVGDDQKQHLELTRDIAQKFNNDYSARIAELGVGVEMMVGEETVNGFFPLTEPLIEGPAPRVMSLRDGTKKMSKSDPSDLSRINLTDDAETHRPRRSARPRPIPAALPSEVEGLKGRPEAENLVVHLCGARRHGQGAGAAGIRRPPVLRLQAGAGRPGRHKLAPIAAEMRRISADPAYVDAVLRDGGERGRRAGGGDDEDGSQHSRSAGRLSRRCWLFAVACRRRRGGGRLRPVRLHLQG